MNYLSLIEPRQQGKTSMINHLMGQFRPLGYVFAYSDLTTLDRGSESAWYRSLCDWVLRQTSSVTDPKPTITANNGNTWLEFLRSLSVGAQRTGVRLVLALDEIGAVPENWGTQFFSIIRSIYNSRESTPCFKHLTFIVAGAYNPRELIKDPTISSFNVDHRVPLPDFNPSQLSTLVSYLATGDQAAVLTDRLYFWTGGQPFISQRLCRYLAEQEVIDPDVLDLMVERFIQNDFNHLPRIQAYFENDPELLDYARRIIKQRAKLTPSVNTWQFQLSHVIGVVSADSGGRCQLRNRIYQKAFSELLDQSADQGISNPPAPSTVSDQTMGRAVMNRLDVAKSTPISAISYALAIGISAYHNLRKLRKSTADAQDLCATLVQRGYPAGNVFQLLDDQATKLAINDSLNYLAEQVTPADTVVIFFAGHGVQFLGGFKPGEYLCPVDARLDWSRETLISRQELTDALGAIHAGRLVVFLDACHAGGVSGPQDTGQWKPGLSQASIEGLVAGHGRVIIASCRPDELSWEIAGMRNGLFTNYLLDGLRGGAADPAGQVWISRLFGHVYQGVSRSDTPGPQHPFQKAAAEDFVIVPQPVGSKDPVSGGQVVGSRGQRTPGQTVDHQSTMLGTEYGEEDQSKIRKALGVDQPKEAITATLQTALDASARGAMFQQGGICSGYHLEPMPDRFFVVRELGGENDDLRAALAGALADFGVLPVRADDFYWQGPVLCKIASLIQGTPFGVYRIGTSQDRNVCLELGISLGLGRPFVLVKDRDAALPPLLESIETYEIGSYLAARHELGPLLRPFIAGIGTYQPPALPRAGLQATAIIAHGDLEPIDFTVAVAQVLHRCGLLPVVLEDPRGEIGRFLEMEKIPHETPGAAGRFSLDATVAAIHAAQLGVYRIDAAASPNAMLALGVSLGLNRPGLLTLKQQSDVPNDLKGLPALAIDAYSRLPQTFEQRFGKLLTAYRDAGDRWH